MQDQALVTPVSPGRPQRPPQELQLPCLVALPLSTGARQEPLIAMHMGWPDRLLWMKHLRRGKGRGEPPVLEPGEQGLPHDMSTGKALGCAHHGPPQKRSACVLGRTKLPELTVGWAGR